MGGGFYYEQFPNGNVFGYYNVVNFPVLHHVDMGFEYFLDANDGHGGAYLYDFASSTFWYTSPTFSFPYLSDCTLKTFLYYDPDPNNPGHYHTNGKRYFYNFATGKIITKIAPQVSSHQAA